MIPVMIVPILNTPDLLYKMLASIDYPVTKLIIIDNGDCLNTDSGWPVEHVQSTKVIKMPSNLGVAGSWNLGIKAAPFAPWWLVVNFDVEWPAGSLEKFDKEAETDSVILAGGWQPWSAFALGEGVVTKVGLFDEAYYPAYFEDNDYEDRCLASGVRVERSNIQIAHRNSSTLQVGNLSERNLVTFPANQAYYSERNHSGWSLERRRRLTWD